MKNTGPFVNTHFAQAHVGAIRRKVTRPPTWEDVADAYDAGLRHAALADGRHRQRLQEYLKAMRLVNSVHQEKTP